jgi:hypothetical protein
MKKLLFNTLRVGSIAACVPVLDAGPPPGLSSTTASYSGPSSASSLTASSQHAFSGGCKRNEKHG